MLYLPISGCVSHFVKQVITIVQLHSKESGVNFCACSHPALSLSVVYDDENLWQWFPVETKLHSFNVTGLFLYPLNTSAKPKVF